MTDDRSPEAAPAADDVVEVREVGDVLDLRDRVTTGVLAADSTSRIRLARQRRWLVGTAVLGVVVVLAFVLGATLAAELAEDRARVDAALADAEAAFATDVVERAEAYERPTLQVRIDAPVLRGALEDHLVQAAPDTDALAATVDRTATSLRSSGDTIDDLTARDLPTVDPSVDEETVQAVAVELEQLRSEARALVEEVRAATTGVEEWAAAVVALDRALAAHAAVVEDKPTSDDPADLAAGWRSEVPALEDLVAQAERSAEAPGLDAWAAAHAEYAQDTIAFIESAVPLLEGGELTRYNELFLDTFSSGDPFGFRTAARTGAASALEAEPITAVAALEARATIVLDQLTLVEQTVATRFADGA